jgi:phospholipase C
VKPRREKYRIEKHFGRTIKMAKDFVRDDKIGPGGDRVSIPIVSIQSVAFPGVCLRMDGGGVTTPTATGGGVVNCQFGVGGSGAKSYEKFLIHKLGNGKVEIESIAFRNIYLRMDSCGLSAPDTHGGGIVNCQYGIGGARGGVSFEKFRLVAQPDDAVAIESIAFPGVFLRMDGGGVTAQSSTGGGRVNCQFGVGGSGMHSFEKFRLNPESI